MLSGKATSFIGPLLYGIAVAATGTERAGMSIVIVLMVAGYFLMPRR